MQNLRTNRQSKGLSQLDLADLANVRQPTISLIEGGRCLPQSATINTIESLLGPVDWVSTLLGDRKHIFNHLKEFLNLDAEGAIDRIQFCRQCLTLIEKSI